MSQPQISRGFLAALTVMARAKHSINIVALNKACRKARIYIRGAFCFARGIACLLASYLITLAFMLGFLAYAVIFYIAIQISIQLICDSVDAGKDVINVSLGCFILGFVIAAILVAPLALMIDRLDNRYFERRQWVRQLGRLLANNPAKLAKSNYEVDLLIKNCKNYTLLLRNWGCPTDAVGSSVKFQRREELWTSAAEFPQHIDAIATAVTSVGEVNPVVLLLPFMEEMSLPSAYTAVATILWKRKLNLLIRGAHSIIVVADRLSPSLRYELETVLSNDLGKRTLIIAKCVRRAEALVDQRQPDVHDQKAEDDLIAYCESRFDSVIRLTKWYGEAFYGYQISHSRKWYEDIFEKYQFSLSRKRSVYRQLILVPVPDDKVKLASESKIESNSTVSEKWIFDFTSIVTDWCRSPKYLRMSINTLPQLPKGNS